MGNHPIKTQRESRRPRRGVSAVALVFLVAPGCLLLAGRHWDATRVEIIDPINAALHRNLPGDLRGRDLDAVLGHYATDTGTGVVWGEPLDLDGDSRPERRMRWTEPRGEEPLRRRYERFLDLFAVVERAELRIHRVYWEDRNATGYPAEVRLLVRGRGPGGDRRVLDQRALLHLDRVGGRWRITAEEVTARELVAAAAPGFDVVTDAAGLNDDHDTEGSPVFRLIGDVAVSSGVAVADVNCDGHEDVALLGSSRIGLYRNKANGRFVDVADEMGFRGGLDVVAAGLVFFDADNDGDPDLWVSGLRGDRFYRNEECGRFVDATVEAGIGPSRWSSMPLVADFDRDGFLDVYVVRMGDHELTAPAPNWDARNGVADSLYRNNGDGTFSDVTKAAGIRETGWGLAGAWGDYDGDGFPDLYVGNEFGTNSLYRNNGDGTFSEVAAAAGVLDRGAAMGVAWGDYDNDGRLDLYVSNMYANSRWALFHPEFPPPIPWYLKWVPRSDVHQIVDELTRGSTLLRNNGDGTFTDVSESAGIRDAQWGWAALFLDYDNDGWLDIYATNGFVTGDLPDDV
jgi:hypothetical protein